MTALTHLNFEPHLKEMFSIHYNHHEALSVILSEITFWGDNQNSPDGGIQQPFALIFQSSITAYLPQGTYRITHPVIGEQDIFIVPLGPNTTGMRYEATFG